ncbi:MAG: hypothetical protein HQL18_00765 [Candidatus Omnitrophica bacterium]|nr:hypothetical protein [Candidatus Omnitrophota bacterium]
MDKKVYFCPECNAQLFLDSVVEAFLGGCNQADGQLGKDVFHFRHGSGARVTCLKCSAKLEFDWKAKRFKRVNVVNDFIRPAYREERKLSLRQSVILLVVLGAIALLLSWLLARGM